MSLSNRENSTIEEETNTCMYTTIITTIKYPQPAGVLVNLLSIALGPIKPSAPTALTEKVQLVRGSKTPITNLVMLDDTLTVLV